MAIADFPGAPLGRQPGHEPLTPRIAYTPRSSDRAQICSEGLTTLPTEQRPSAQVHPSPAQLGRHGPRAAGVHIRRGSEVPRITLLVGSGRLALHAYQRLRHVTGAGVDVVGFVDDAPHNAVAETGLPWLGNTALLGELLLKNHVQWVFVALPVKSSYDAIQRTIHVCNEAGVPVTVLGDVFDLGRSTRRFDMHATMHDMTVDRQHPLVGRVMKRVIDALVASTALVLLAPLMLTIALAIRHDDPGPALFAQERCGLLRRRFRMLKFRTMRVGAEQQQDALETLNESDGAAFKIRRDPRVTRLGNFLRSSSLDELPQLWNILCGEMSLVGPRPLPERDVYRFAERAHVRRFSVKPGLTGLWQVSGRSDLPFSEWMRLDLDYVDRASLRLDLSILFRTIPAVFAKRGAH